MTLAAPTVRPKKRVSLGFWPSETQKQFLASATKYTAFGGARGGGKSWSIRTKADMLAYEYPGIRILIVRQTYAELDRNHIQPLRKQLFGRAKYNGTDKIFSYPNGSTISFMYCRNDADLNKLQGAEYEIIFIDEATLLTEYQIKEIAACMRAVNYYPKRMYLTCNPGGPSHQYIKRVFVDRAFKDDEDPAEYSFIQSLVTDNYVLMHFQPDYIKNLDSLPQRRKAAWRFGDWDIYEGQYFSEFSDVPANYDTGLYTHVINPFNPPRAWGDIYRSFDWGYGKPFSVGWWVVDPAGAVYRILELYGCEKNEPNVGVQWTNDEIFARVAEIERTHPYIAGRKVWGVADPACWDGSRGESIIAASERYGLSFKKAINDRIPGWMQMRYRMQFDQNGRSRFYVTSNCKAFIRTIRLQIFDEKNPEDLDTKMEDHACVTGDTLIMTPDGWKRIDQVTQDMGSLLAHDLRYHSIQAGGMTARQADVFTIETDDGRTITATADHLFMLADGTWRRLDELKDGDELMDAAEVRVINKTAQEFCGERYYLCGNYFQRNGKRLHRAVWEYWNGDIPKGMHVHHKDGNRQNNSIANLVLMDGSEHQQKHMTAERRRQAEKRMAVHATPKAKDWHGTEDGKRWHSQHAKKTWAKRSPSIYACSHCGNEFESLHIYADASKRFCSNSCKSAYRRALKADT